MPETLARKIEHSDRSGLLLALFVAASALAVGLILQQRQHFLVYHTIVELVGISLAWCVFLILWNARTYQDDDSFVLLGIGFFGASLLDLLHTLAFKGVNLWPSPDPANQATQLWIAARFVESIACLLFPLTVDRRAPIRIALVATLLITAVLALSILAWGVFPPCFQEGQGLTPFKTTSEYVVVAVTLLAMALIHRRRARLDSRLHLLLLVTFACNIAAELTFTLYREVASEAVVIGHALRVLAHFALYLALVHLSIQRPQVLLLRHLQDERRRLADSEQRWRALSQSHPDHVLDVDADLVIRFANYPSPGLTMDQLLGASILSFLGPEQRPGVEAALHEVLATGQQQTYETTYTEPDGNTIHYETTAVARETIDGTTGLTLVSRDISTRKRIEAVWAARMRISERALGVDVTDVLQHVLDEAEDLTGSLIGFFHFVDEDGEALHLQTWSTRTLQQMCTADGVGLHYPVSQAGVWADCIRERRTVVHNDYANLSQRKGLPEGHAPVIREIVVPVRRQGRVVAVLGVGNKPRDYVDDDVQLVSDLADLAWDIVERKRAELALAESERRLVSTMASLPGMVYRCANDEHWTMEFASAGCLDLTGYRPDELIDNAAVAYGDLILPEDAETVRVGVEAALRQHEFFHLRYRIRRKDGQVVWVGEQGRGFFLNDQLQSLEGFIYDVTDQVDTEEKQRQLEHNVLEAQKLESLGVLAGGIAHDFNNLLQSILGNAQLARADLSPESPCQPYLDQVLHASRRAADLTGQMLAYSGHGSFVLERQDLSQLVSELAGLLRSSIPRHVELSCHLAPAGTTVEGDPAQLQQVVLNLVTNAAESIEHEQGLVELTTSCRHCAEADFARNVPSLYPGEDQPAPGEYVSLVVQDNGSGMAPAVQARIFEPFFTTKFTGRGLGLAAVLGILRAHRGALIIDSRSRGTRIEVLLPACDEASPARMAGARAVPAAASLPPQDGGLVLVVDDEQQVRELAARVLERDGIVAVCRDNGEEALAWLDQAPRPPDLVLLDLTMPRMGGERCHAILRERLPEVPVLLMSGYSADELERRFDGIDVAGFLSKPFEPDELVLQIREIIPRS